QGLEGRRRAPALSWPRLGHLSGTPRPCRGRASAISRGRLGRSTPRSVLPAPGEQRRGAPQPRRLLFMDPGAHRRPDRAPMAATPWIDDVACARGPGGAARERTEARGDSAPLALALAKTVGACGDISCAVTRLAGRCAPLLLRARKEMPSVGGGGGA
uniref:Uncharacterized protein n=1 Tax=Aegilops tauschii subsp. strangulata TaxID=200361 RepID=A0A453DCA0_AEGTS